MRRHAVNLVIRSHYAHDAAFCHGRFEARQEEFAEHTLGIVCGSDVGTAFGLAMSGKVLRRGNDVITIDTWSWPLQGPDDCDRHAGDEIRVFAVSFLCAAPTRIAREIEIRTKHLLAAASSGLKRSGSENLCFLWPCDRGGSHHEGSQEFPAGYFQSTTSALRWQKGLHRADPFVLAV